MEGVSSSGERFNYLYADAELSGLAIQVFKADMSGEIGAFAYRTFVR